jgi:quinone-modifying oxidoreductase subunit QmoA
MQQKHVLVVGGGISGITTALEIAEVGHNVTLIEKKPYLGGKVVQFSKYFPKLCPPQCGLEINFQRIRKNPRVEILTSSGVDSIDGTHGNFKVKIKRKAQLINSNCTACGKCADVCPVERENEFNYSLDKTKAAYLPHEMAFPFKYTIDEQKCLKNECKKCLDVCEYNAINLEAEDEVIERLYYSIVYATGWESYDASNLELLNYGNHPDIITNVIFERYAAPNGPTGGKIIKPSDGKEPKTIAFIQCAGSRDENHLPYCSAVCCSASLKHALIAREQLKDVKIKIFYIDIRVTGRNEDFLNKVKADENIDLIKGKAGKVEVDNGQLMVLAEDILSGVKSKTEADLVVLATGIQPALKNSSLAKDEYGYLLPEKLSSGIFAASNAKRPLDVSASIKDATGISLKAIQNHEV